MKLPWVLPLTMAPFLTTCMAVEAINIHLTLDGADFYRGVARIEFVGIHSTDTNPKKRKAEMQDFFASYRRDADRILATIPLQEHRVLLRNRTDISTDAVLVGNFRNLVAVLSGVFTDQGEFRFEGNRRRLSVYWKNPRVEKDNVSLIVQYAGNIVSHNSKSFDAATQTMRWNLNRTGDPEIQFTLASDPQSSGGVLR